MQCNAYKCNSTNLVPRLPNNEWWVLAVSQSAQSWQAVNYRTAGQRSCEQLIKWVMQQLFNLWSCKWAKTITHCLQTMIQGQCSPWNGKLLACRKFYISSVIYIEREEKSKAWSSYGPVGRCRSLKHIMGCLLKHIICIVCLLDVKMFD